MISSLKLDFSSSATVGACALVRRLMAFFLVFALAAPFSIESADAASSADSISISMPSDAGEHGAGGPADHGLVCHIDCGCHQRIACSEPAIIAPLEISELSYFVGTDVFSSRASSPPRKPPRAN